MLYQAGQDGLKIKPAKTKLLHSGTTTPCAFDGEQIDEAECLQYLGSNISKDAGATWIWKTGYKKRRQNFEMLTNGKLLIGVIIWMGNLENNKRHRDSPPSLRILMFETHHAFYPNTNSTGDLWGITDIEKLKV